MKRSSRYAWLIGLCVLAAGAVAAYCAYDRGLWPIARPATPRESKQPEKSPEAEVKDATFVADPSDPPWADPKPKDVRRLRE